MAEMVKIKSRDAWISKAACKGMTDLYFPPEGNNYDPVVQKTCDACPVLEPCQEWAVYHEGHGFQGGLTPRQREKVRSKLGIYLREPTSNILAIVRYG